MSNGIDLAEKLSTFSEHWSPRTVTTFNDCDVMVVKVEGEFVWHKHDDTDELRRARRHENPPTNRRAD